MRQITPIKRIWASNETHPPVAQRVERLREQTELGAGGTPQSEQP